VMLGGGAQGSEKEKYLSHTARAPFVRVGPRKEKKKKKGKSRDRSVKGKSVSSWAWNGRKDSGTVN